MQRPMSSGFWDKYRRCQRHARGGLQHCCGVCAGQVDASGDFAIESIADGAYPISARCQNQALLANSSDGVLSPSVSDAFGVRRLSSASLAFARRALFDLIFIRAENPAACRAPAGIGSEARCAPAGGGGLCAGAGRRCGRAVSPRSGCAHLNILVI